MSYVLDLEYYNILPLCDRDNAMWLDGCCCHLQIKNFIGEKR